MISRDLGAGCSPPCHGQRPAGPCLAAPPSEGPPGPPAGSEQGKEEGPTFSVGLGKGALGLNSMGSFHLPAPCTSWASVSSPAKQEVRRLPSEQPNEMRCSVKGAAQPLVHRGGGWRCGRGRGCAGPGVTDKELTLMAILCVIRDACLSPSEPRSAPRRSGNRVVVSA